MTQETVTAKESTYNGHTNYETWCVALWLGNDEGTYRTVRAMAAEAREASRKDRRVLQGYWEAEHAPVYLLADALKELVNDAAPDLGPSVFGDLLSAALSEVDWQDVAEGFLED